MYLGGLNYAGTVSRPAAAGPASSDAEADIDETPGRSPAYFRTISTISHASLAAAYQAMRAQELTMVPVDPPLPGEPDQEASVAAGAISSGAGIPSAMSAYAEVIDEAGVR